MSSLATKERRLMNYVLDLIIFLLLGLAYRYLRFIFSDTALLDFKKEMFTVRPILSIPIAIVYYSFFESITGRTPAKYVTKTKVVNVNGEKPSFKSIVLKSACRFIPLNPFTFIFLDVGLHDKISKTRVVHIN